MDFGDIFWFAIVLFATIFGIVKDVKKGKTDDNAQPQRPERSMSTHTENVVIPVDEPAPHRRKKVRKSTAIPTLAIPEEGERVTLDLPPMVQVDAAAEEARAEKRRQLRKAIIFSEILPPKF